MKANTKLIGTLATIAIVGLSITGGAAVASQDVTIDDPANDSVEVDVDFSAAVNGTVELINSSGSVVDSQTISGSSGTTETFSVSATTAGDYSVNLTTDGSSSDVAINETRLIAERSVSVTDAGNETVMIDLAFQGSTNATGDVELYNGTGSLIHQKVVNHDSTGDQTTYTVEINESDGLVNGDYTANVTINPASAFDSAYATVSGPSSGGLLGGTIFGQDTSVAIAGLLVIGGVGYYARREDMI